MDTVTGPMADERLVARANSYCILARTLCSPATWDEGLLAGLRDHFQPLGAELGDLASNVANEMQYVWSDREPVSVAFAKLFIGPFEIDAPPYASLYLDPERRLMGPVSLAVAEFYAEAGLGPSAEGPRDAPDHVTHELEFMYFLAFESARSGDPIWMDRAARFWRTHLGDWLPRFAESLMRAERHPVYDALGKLLLRFAGEESVLFGVAHD